MTEPTAKAFRFVIDGSKQQYDAYIDLVSGAFEDKVIDCRYRVIGSNVAKWVYLVAPSIYPSHVDTSEKTNANFDAAIIKINNKISEVFGTAPDEPPVKGFELIEWLIQVGLKELNNVVSRI